MGHALCRVASNDFVELAHLARRSFFLVQQGEFRRLEFLEPFVPADLLQRPITVVLWKLETHAGFATARGASDGNRFGATFLRPAANFVVIRCDSRGRAWWHGGPLLWKRAAGAVL